MSVSGSDGAVADDLRCVRCGYSLRGLGLPGACPECDLPIAESAAAAKSVAADPVRGVMGGARMVALSAQLMLLSLGAGYVLTVVQRRSRRRPRM